jgi:hypothetical protein
MSCGVVHAPLCQSTPPIRWFCAPCSAGTGRNELNETVYRARSVADREIKSPAPLSRARTPAETGRGQSSASGVDARVRGIRAGRALETSPSDSGGLGGRRKALRSALGGTWIVTPCSVSQFEARQRRGESSTLIAARTSLRTDGAWVVGGRERAERVDRFVAAHCSHRAAEEVRLRSLGSRFVGRTAHIGGSGGSLIAARTSL